jgi:hypothetical protein
VDPKPSYPYDPELHEPSSPAGDGRCSYHSSDSGACDGAAVVSYQDDQGRLQSGCARALAHLVDRGEIQPLGQGA